MYCMKKYYLFEFGIIIINFFLEMKKKVIKLISSLEHLI